MVDGFFHRVARSCELAGPRLGELADKARRAGFPTQAGILQSVADTVSRLAYDAGKDDVDFARVAENTYACARALEEVVFALTAVEDELAAEADEIRGILERIGGDALSQTQPL